MPRGDITGAMRRVLGRLRDFAYAGPSRIGARPAVAGRPRIGLALGGGFARGLAHLGVLKVFAEGGVPIDALAGTSVGAVVAAAFASGLGVDEMIQQAREVRWKALARWTLPRMGLATNERMDDLLPRVLRCSTFKELKTPLAVVATDISTGEAVVFRDGDLIAALRASCSVPGLFAPIEAQGRLLVDGMLVASVPASAVRAFSVDTVVAVHLNTGELRHRPANIFQVVGQAFQIAERLGDAAWRKACDYVIEPDVSEFEWDDFDRADDLILAGERAARQALRALLKVNDAQPRSAGDVAVQCNNGGLAQNP